MTPPVSALGDGVAVEVFVDGASDDVGVGDGVGLCVAVDVGAHGLG